MLFACGSLAEEHYRRRIFGENLPVFPARMLHWGRYRGTDGQEFARQLKGAEVDGYVIPVNAKQIEAADRSASSWNLQRAVTMIEIDGARTWAFVYTRRGDGEFIS
jgi:hypothetical protein